MRLQQSFTKFLTLTAAPLILLFTTTASAYPHRNSSSLISRDNAVTAGILGTFTDKTCTAGHQDVSDSAGKTPMSFSSCHSISGVAGMEIWWMRNDCECKLFLSSLKYLP
jgi:hypothetical protein